MVLYQAGNFEDAGDLFRQAALAGGMNGDAPSTVFAARSALLAASPPDGAWDGVFVMHHK